MTCLERHVWFLNAQSRLVVIIRGTFVQETGTRAS